MAIEQVRERLKSEVEKLRGEIATLMQTAVQVSSEVMTEAQDEVVISGERNLLAVSDFSSDMGHLRRAFELFEQKTQLMRLLDISSQAAGVRIFIGGESQVVPFEELSIVSAPYEVDGQVVGTARRDRPDAHAVRPHDPDRRHHVEAGQQRAEPPQVTAAVWQSSRRRPGSMAPHGSYNHVRSGR